MLRGFLTKMIRLTEKEEERAFDLHRKSIVVVPHRDSASCDVAERRSRGERKVMESRQLPILEQGGVTCVIESVGGDTTLTSTFPLRAMHSSASDSLKRSLICIDSMVSDLHESREKLTHATKASDVSDAKEKGKVAVIFGFEGGSPLQGDLGLLRTFYRLGVRCVQPAWIFRNTIVDGVWERTTGDISNFGLEVIAEMNELGMLIDVSHMKDQGFQDVMEATRKPVIASHSNSRSICDHPRNLSDDQIKALAENEGVMGLNVGFVHKNGPPTLQGLLEHVDHVVDLVGADHVGIFGDLNEQFPEEIYREIWKDTLFSFSFPRPQGLESLSKLPNFTKGLVSRGYSDQEIEKILGANFLRVFRDVFGE